MCNFLSAIVTPDGEVHTFPEATDSHQDIVDFLGLKDEGRGEFVRVEFVPGSDITNLDEYQKIVDQRNTPEWFSESVKDNAFAFLRDLVSRMIVRDSRKAIAGGCWILVGEANIERAVAARIISMRDSSTVKEMRGSSTVGEMLDSSTVGVMWGSSTVKEMRGSSTVGEMRDSSTVKEMRGSSTVGEMLDSSTVGEMLDSSTVGADNRTNKVTK